MQLKVLLVLGAMLVGSQTGQGGGVVTNCTEAGLHAALAGGGAVTFACDGTIAVTATITITNNTSLDAGGHRITISGSSAVGVFQVFTNVQCALANLTVANGLATNGAGLLNAGGTVNATNCTFSGNQVVSPVTAAGTGASVLGGAIANLGVLRLANCSFVTNCALGGAGGAEFGDAVGYAGGDGAGGAVWNSGLLFASGCTFSRNSAVGGTGGAGGSQVQFLGMPFPSGGPGGNGYGGALFNCGAARLVNCTLAGNLGTGGAGGPGGSGPNYPPQPPGPNGPPGSGAGGIYDLAGQCYVTNCTVVFNSGAGIWTTNSNGAKLINTLLSGNSPGGNGAGALTDLGHNLSSDLTCALTNVGSLNNLFPLLGPLTNNGGPTLTVALLAGCPAIDAGDTLAAPPTDQRGVPRPHGLAADIGAYEYDLATNPGPSTVVIEGTEGGLLAAMTRGGHVTFACDGTILLSNTIVITTNTWLDAAGHPIVLQGNAAGLFLVGTNVVFSVADLVFTGGQASAGAVIQNAGGTVKVTNCVFSGNSATCGGAIQNEAGQIWLYACGFTNNRAGLRGGALDNSGTMIVDLCSFVRNSAAGVNGSPGNGYGEDGGSGRSAAGGAIYNGGILTISRSTLSSNTVAAGSGASGHAGNWGEFSMGGGRGGNGGSGGDGAGGALYNAGVAQLSSSTFSFNAASGGSGGVGGDGGGSAYGGAGSGGTGGWGGTAVGALFNQGDLRILNCTFAFNSGLAGSAGAGGAGGSTIYSYGGSGGAGGNGGSVAGAIYDFPPSVSWMTNCTFALNSGLGAAAGAGGNAGLGTIQNGNPGLSGSAGSLSGGINTAGGRLINSVLASNLPGGNCAGTLLDLGHNLSSDATCAFTDFRSSNNTDPRLGPLANNGGPTLTLALLPNSPAIDAGDDTAAPDVDQRGLPRPIGRAADIGAFEYGSPALLAASPSATGGIEVSAIGQPWQVCWLLTSETLLEWVPVVTNQFNGAGSVLFQVNTGPSRRFYRVFLP